MIGLITILILAVVPNASAKSRPLVAVGRFELPMALNNVTPATLTDLMVEHGARGLRYRAILATDVLQRIGDWYRAKNILPTAKDIKVSVESFDNLITHTRLLLLPTITRLGDEWLATATVVDLRTNKSWVIKVTRKGDVDSLKEVVKDLWWQLDMPPLLSTFDKSIHCLRFSNDGVLVAGNHSEFGTTGIWDVRTGLGRFITRSAGDSYSWVFSPDSKLLVGFEDTKDHRLRALDVKTGNAKFAVSHTSYTTCFICNSSFSQDCSLLANLAGDQTIRVLDGASGVEKYSLSNPSGFGRPVFSPRGHLLAAPTHDGTVSVWDADNGMEKYTVRGKNDSIRFVSLCFSPDSKLLLTRLEGDVNQVWDSNTGRPLYNFSSSNLRCFFDKDCRLLAVSDKNGTLCIYAASTGLKKYSLASAFGPPVVHRPAYNPFRPDGRLIATLDNDGILRSFDSNTGKLFFTLEGKHKQFEFSANSELLVSITTDQAIQFSDANTGQALFTLTYSKKIKRIEFNTNSQFLLAECDDDTTVIWDCGPAR